MITIPIEPYWDKLQEYHSSYNPKKLDFWDWLRRDYNAYQVYIQPNPTALGEKAACGIMFGEEDEATFFALKWA